MKLNLSLLKHLKVKKKKKKKNSGEQEKESIIEKSAPRDHRTMTNGDPEGRFFLSYPHILGDAAKYFKKY